MLQSIRQITSGAKEINYTMHGDENYELQQRFFKALSESNNLKKLSINGQFEFENLNLLKNNSSLIELWLENSYIGANEVDLIVSVLKNTKIFEIFIDANNLEYNSLKTLTEAINEGFVNEVSLSFQKNDKLIKNVDRLQNDNRCKAKFILTENHFNNYALMGVITLTYGNTSKIPENLIASKRSLVKKCPDYCKIL